MYKKFIFSILISILSLPAFAQELVVSEAYDVETHEAYTPSFKRDGKHRRPKNVILMIGDGMGLAQLSAGMYINGKSLTITNLRTSGFVRTQSASDFTTDSAASGTAYSTGHKTYNGAIGVDVDGNALPNLPERLAPFGFVSGIVTTDPVNGATPSAFFAHQSSRGMTNEIWGDLPASKLSFIAAGSQWEYNHIPDSTRESINDSFTVVSTLDEAPADASRIAFIPEYDLIRQYDSEFKRGNYLPETTEYAIDFLSSRSKKGFFLLVEGAHIDHACHGNQFDGTCREVLDFDRAVEAAVRFAEEDGNTLVIISADHETGMLALNYIESHDDGNYGRAFYTSSWHSPIMVPLFAYGPSSRKFSGVQENSDVSNKIFHLMTGK